jgi:MFS family permease
MPLPHALRSLRHRNVRLFLSGQAVSLVGSWMQGVAMSWLAWRLTGSAQLLGLVTFLSQVPVFFLAPWAGSLADRLPRRRMVQATQVNAMLQAAAAATLAFTGVVQPWHLLVLAAMLGLTYAFEIPARHALLADISGEDSPNAVALNSTVVNLARVVGPTLAGVVVATVGEAWCFLLNALSFLATLGALQALRLPPHAPPQGRMATWHHLVEGLSFATGTPWVRRVLLLSLFASLFALPYQTLMPVYAEQVLGGGPRTLGQLLAAAGAGALTGAVLLLLRRHGGGSIAPRVGVGAVLLGSGLLGAAAASRAPAGLQLPLALGALVLAGGGFITQFASTMTLLHAEVPERLRGRVLGLFSMLFVGMTPFGALAGGTAAAHVGTPPTLGVGGALVLLAGAWFLRPRRPAPARSTERSPPHPPQAGLPLAPMGRGSG